MNSEDNLRIKEFKGVLEDSVLNASQVFVVAHDNPDLDAIASALGIYYIVRSKFKKPCYIIVNDQADKLEPGVKKVIDKEKGIIPFINLKKYLELKGDNDLLVTTDVNKVNRVSVGEHLANFNDVVLIDHHGEDEHTISTDKKFITCGVSSASEIVTKLFGEFRSSIEESLATYLLA
ncbi:MAG: DHH family phosphoesterase [Bacilli bacterium]|nr:DHH family phosphoesterase [Bacilli bacterium]